jgi:hypothetical protein
MAQSIKRSAANPYRTGGPSRYFQTRGGTSSIPTTGIRTGANVSVGGGKGGAPAAKGASAEAPKVPTGVEPGEPSAPEYNPIIDAETMSPSVDPNRQEAILNQARAPRFAIGNPGVGSIDLGSLLSAKPTEGFDPKAPIGGANVPFQETKGVGGYFRRLFGDTANEQNVAAQQAQAAEWKAEDTLAKERQGKREDLANEIALRTEAERGLKKEDREFTAGQSKAARDFQAAENSLDRVMRTTEGGLDRNLRVSLAAADRDAAASRLDKEFGFRSSESAADRAFRSSEGAAERGFRAGESQADRAARLAEGEANRAVTAAHYNLIREDNAADRNLRASEGAAGRELQREGQGAEIQYKQRPRFERLGENVYTNEKGEVFEHTPGMPAFGNNKGTPGGFRRLPTPGAMAPKGSGGGQVDRTTGATLGGPLMNNQLPPGGGVMRSGGTAATMGAAQPTAEPRYATLGDRLLTLPGMGAIVDMPRIMNPERTARLAESRSLQDAENRERIRRMQQEAGGDIGPSMF